MGMGRHAAVVVAIRGGVTARFFFTLHADCIVISMSSCLLPLLANCSHGRRCQFGSRNRVSASSRGVFQQIDDCVRRRSDKKKHRSTFMSTFLNLDLFQ